MLTQDKYKLIWVKWVDSQGGTNRWEDINDLEPEPHYIISVGYLIHDKNEHRVIAAHISFNDESDKTLYACQGYMTIPYCQTIEVKELSIT